MKLTESSLRQLIREVIREADESDKYTHIGYGRYKEKGKEKDKDAETFKKTDSGKFEPFGDKEGGEKDKPEPKQTKIAADPFADKDSETGKDYTKKFTGTDEPEDEDDEAGEDEDDEDGEDDYVEPETAEEHGVDMADHWLEDPSDAAELMLDQMQEYNPEQFDPDHPDFIQTPEDFLDELSDPMAFSDDDIADMYTDFLEEHPKALEAINNRWGSGEETPSKDSETGDDEEDWPEDDPRWDVPPKPDDLKDFLDGFGKTDVYSSGEVSNEMMGEFDFEDNKVTYSNSNFEELDDWNLAKDVLGPLKKAGIKYKKYKDEYSAGVIVNTEDLEGLTDVLKQTVGNKDGGGDAGEEKEKPKPWKSWEYKPGMGMEINPDELTGVDYNQKEMEEWVDNQRTRGVLATASRDTLAKIAKYDPKANPQSKMNSKPGGELIQHMADVFDMEADTIPLYKEIEYMAKLANDQRIPAKMADLFREASTGAREYWYVQLGLRRPEDLDTAPPSFKESIIPQLKKEFKQYDFTQKSKNWKQVMI